MEEQGQATVRAPSAAFSIEAILRSGVMGAGRQEVAGAMEAGQGQQVKREAGEGAGEAHSQVGDWPLATQVQYPRYRLVCGSNPRSCVHVEGKDRRREI